MNLRNSTNFWDVNWGPDEAKGDSDLGKYFVRIPEYDALKEGEYRYIIGRKGTGKTAIIEQLILEANRKHDNFHKYLSLKNFPIQTLRGIKDKSLGNKSQFVPIWTFLILTELCKLIISDQSCQPIDSVQEIKEFININFPEDLGFSETLRILETTNNKVNILPQWLGFGSEKENTTELFVSVHYQKVNEVLLKLISTINSECTFYLLFDEPDEGYSSNDKSLNLLLLALLRSVENTYLELKDYIKYRPVLALRSDIFNNLQDNDLNKLDDYIINLKWTKESKSPYSLYDLVNARINASISVTQPENAWEKIVLNKDQNIPPKVKTLWDFIYNRTFERPRDIIKFLKYCKKQNPNILGKLNFKNVLDAEIDYSSWFYNEFRDEIQSHLTIWQETTQAIIKLNKGIFSFDEIKREFDKNNAIVKYCEVNNQNYEDILESLFNFGLIGTLSERNRWFFKYKDHNLPYDIEKNMIVHFGFVRKFRIKPY